MAANFCSCRDSGVTWLALTGFETTRIMRRVGHDDPKTTLDYVKMAEDLIGQVGRLFGPLPAELLGQRLGQVNANPRKAERKGLRLLDSLFCARVREAGGVFEAERSARVHK
jgi:hypothetical protein